MINKKSRGGGVPKNEVPLTHISPKTISGTSTLSIITDKSELERKLAEAEAAREEYKLKLNEMGSRLLELERKMADTK